MDVVIGRNGDWYHDGSKIQREPLIKLFASILRREQDGEYYLVSPVEKWRIQVEDTALIILAVEIENRGKPDQRILFTSNVGEAIVLNADHPLTVVSTEGQPNPVVALANGLTAKLHRNVFYQLVEYAEPKKSRYAVCSDGEWFYLD